MNSSFQNPIYTIVKFQPHNIILQHNLTRKLYKYEEKKRDVEFKFDDELIVKAQLLCEGFIYEKQLTSLHKQLEPKFSKENHHSFSQAELNNTFQPILNYLQKGNKHGALSFDSILIDNEGNIKLKDPRLTSKKDLVNNDFQQLGFLILQCALLKTENEIRKIKKDKESLVALLKNFSTKFIINLWILLNNTESLVKIIRLSQQNINDSKYEELVQEFQKIKSQLNSPRVKLQVFKPVQEKRIIVIPPLNLKFNKTKKTPILKLDFDGKKRPHNQNQNEESIPKKTTKNIIQEKYVNHKLGGKDEDHKIKFKKLELIDNFRTPLKRKGKTVQKRTK